MILQLPDALKVQRVAAPQKYLERRIQNEKKNDFIQTPICFIDRGYSVAWRVWPERWPTCRAEL
jgi:hypothetical protein